MIYFFKLPNGRVINLLNAEHEQVRKEIQPPFDPKRDKNPPKDIWYMIFYTPVTQTRVQFSSESEANSFYRDLEDLEKKLNKKIFKELTKEDKE